MTTMAFTNGCRYRTARTMMLYALDAMSPFAWYRTDQDKAAGSSHQSRRSRPRRRPNHRGGKAA